MIEFAIGLLLFVLFIAFTVDVLIVGGKRFNIGQETTDIARVLAKQGGVLESVPQGYPGGDKAYLNANQLIYRVEARMKSTGLASYDDKGWEMILTEYDKNGRVVRTGALTPSTHFDVDYMHSFDVKIKAKYNWTLMNIILGNKISETNVGATRHAVSEFKYDFDTWEGEQL